MDKARYLVEAHVLEGRSVSELAAAHGVHRSWIYKLLARYRAGGYEALEPRSRRRARASTRRRRRGQGERAAAGRARAPGHDAGAETLAYHLAQHHKNTPSVSTILRTLRRAGLVVAQRQKRPRCSLIRFHAELTNELWQADITAWQLAS